MAARDRAQHLLLLAGEEPQPGAQRAVRRRGLGRQWRSVMHHGTRCEFQRGPGVATGGLPARDQHRPWPVTTGISRSDRVERDGGYVVQRNCGDRQYSARHGHVPAGARTQNAAALIAAIRSGVMIWIAPKHEPCCTAILIKNWTWRA